MFEELPQPQEQPPDEEWKPENEEDNPDSFWYKKPPSIEEKYDNYDS